MAKSLRNMMGAGIGAGTASLLNGTVADNLTATGSVQADALALTGDMNVLTVVAVASGVRLPALPQPGDEILVANLGANALTVYPPPGATVEGGPTNVPFSLPAGAAAEFVARLGSSNWIALATAGTIAGLTISTAPTLAGDPVVGQTIFATNGTYSSTPDSFTRTWTLGGVVIDGQTDDALLINDIYAGGGVIGYSEVAHKSGLSDPVANPAVPTAAVALIDLTNAITAFSRTSSSGVTPMTWSITFGSNVYAGYMTRWQVFSTSAMTDNPPLQDVHYRLTNDDLQPGANIQAVLAAAGLTAPTATQWLLVTVYTQSPNNVGYLFQVPDPISPTDAAVPMTWSPTDHSASMVLSGGNLTISSPGTWSVARTNRGIGAGKKVYVEMTGDCYVGVADASATLADAHLGAPGDGTATIHASEYQVFGQLIGFNGSNIAAPNPFTSPSDVKGITLDTTGGNPVVTYYLNNVVQGSRTMTGTGSPLFFMTTMPNGKSTTLISGTPGLTTGFTYTPPAGFVAP